MCNRNNNCGRGDESDEYRHCTSEYSDQGVLHVILGIVVSLIALVFIIVCVLHRRRKMKRRKNRKEIEVRYVTRSVVANHHHQQNSEPGSCGRNAHNNHNNSVGGGGGQHQAFADSYDSPYYSPSRTLLREQTEKVSIV